MTVLAHFEDLAIALSDILISVDMVGGGVRIPSIGDPAAADPHLPVRPTKLVRKFFRVQRPRSAGMFLTCGTVSHIEKVIATVGNLITGSVRPPDHLARLFVSGSAASLVDVAAKMTEEAGDDDFELLGVVDAQSYWRHRPVTGSHSLPYWGNVLVMGSGGPDLLKWLRTKGEAFEAKGLGQEDVNTKRIRAQHGVPSMLLEEDTRKTMHTLFKGVGGYYESFTVHSAELRALDDVLTVFGRFKPVRKQVHFELRRIFFHAYDDDDLIIGSLTGLPADVTSSRPLRCPLADLEVFTVPPLGKPRRTLWNASRLAVKMSAASAMRLTTYRGPEDNTIQRFYEGQGGWRLIQFRVSGDSLHLQLDQSALEHYLSRSDFRVPLD